MRPVNTVPEPGPRAPERTQGERRAAGGTRGAQGDSRAGVGRMSDFLQALAQFRFMQYALLAGLLASIGCGVMGSYVVVRRIGFLAGGIAHTVLGGVGVAYLLEAPPLAGAVVAGLLAALLLGWVSLRWREREDSLIAALWATGMSIGVLCLSQAEGQAVDLTGFLFGNILLVSAGDLWLMAALDSVIVLLVALYARQFLAVSFDEEYARLRGVPVTLFHLLLLCLVSLTVVLLIRVVGLLLVIALLSLPAAAAGRFTRSLTGMMLLAILLGAFSTTGGLALAYAPDLPVGAVITLLCAAVYALALLAGGLGTRLRARAGRRGV